MIKKQLYFNLLLLFLVISCAKQENKTIFKLKIISKNIVSKTSVEKSMHKSNRSFPNTNFSNRVFKFSIKNTSKENYILRLRNALDTYPGLYSKEGKNLDLDFLQIIDTIIKDTLEVSRHHRLIYETETTKNKREELTRFYRSLLYNNTLFWYEKNEIINSNFIFLKSNEIKYFETFINLPYSDASNSGNHYNLDSTKNYIANLKFTSDTTNIKKYLTWSQLKNIEENNYKLYQGTIISENSVPIVFVDE